MILLDSSGLIAFYDDDDRYHPAADAVVQAEESLVLSPFVLAESDYMLDRLAGPRISRMLVEDVALGAYDLQFLSTGDVAAALAVMDRYSNLRLGLADASIVVLADRLGCYDVLTLDERHFRTLRAAGGRQFRLLPLDA